MKHMQQPHASRQQPGQIVHEYGHDAAQPHATRPLAMSPEMEARHQQSKRRFPHLALSTGEYVIEEVRRHPIGLLSIWALTTILVVAALSIVPLYAANSEVISRTFMTSVSQLPPVSVPLVIALFLSVLFVLGGIIATVIYNGNRFYITTESIIQYVQTGLFTTKQQVVNLINVEDASSEQVHILEHLLNYGTLRLTTQGEHTHYAFRFVSNPKRVIHTINDASEHAVKRLQGFPSVEY